MSLSSESFTFEIYFFNPSLKRINQVLESISIPLLVLTIVIFFFSENVMPVELRFSFVVIAVLISTTNRMINLNNRLKAVGYTKKLLINANGFSFTDQTLKFSQIQDVVIQVRNSHFENIVSENNILTINSFNTILHIGLVINNSTELNQLNQCVSYLKSKGVKVGYRNFLK